MWHPETVRELVGSEQLADLAGLNAAKVRKDLSHLGTYGTRGVGYDVDFLRFEVSRASSCFIPSPAAAFSPSAIRCMP